MAVRQRTDRVFAPVAALRRKIVRWGCVVTALCTLPAWRMGNRIGRRLTTVALSAERIREGDILTVLPLAREQDELGAMTASVGQLVEDLRHSMSPKNPYLERPASGPSDAPAPNANPGSSDYVRPTGTDPRRVVW